MDAFLSHNRADKETARRLGAQLTLAGAYVWFDDWEVRAGDSIPGKVSEALAAVDTAVLLWSSEADRSVWVRAELEAAIMQALGNGGFRVIPVVLDQTPLPALLLPLKRVDLADGDVKRAVNEIMGFSTDQQRLLAIQETLDEAGLEIRHFEGFGSVVCCPRCGAGFEHLRGWSAVDDLRDDRYAGVECGLCGFQGGGEIGW